MSAALHAFHFLRQAWLAALPLLWAIVWWLAKHRARDGDWTRVIDAELLPSLRLTSAEANVGTPWRWLLLAWSTAVLALAGPSWQQAESPAFRAPAAWVLVLDLSPSMTATDVGPDRVTRARYAIDDLLDGARDARVGLVVFSDEPYVVAPLTQDVATVRSLLPPLAPSILPSQGDHLAPALDAAATLLSHTATRDQKVIVLSDGFDDPAAAFAAAAKLRSQGASVDVVGIGTAGGAPVSRAGGGFQQDAQGHPALARLDEDTLRQLAHSGGGRYAGLDAIASLIGNLQAASPGIDDGTQAAGPDIKVARWLDAGAWLLPAVLLLTALLARKGWL